MPSVNTNENDPMNWSWTTPRPTPRTAPRTRPTNCAARAKYYTNKGLKVPLIFRNCAPSYNNCAARAKYYRNQGLVVPEKFTRCNNNNSRRTRVTNRINRAENAFSILGVPKDSSRAVIRKAYLKLSKIYHPDKGGNANSFRKIKKAYNSLV